MALNPSEVLRPRPKSPEHSKKKILQIADAIEDNIDTALKRPTCRPEYDGSISISIMNLDGVVITSGVIDELTRRYKKSKKNPNGWGSFSVTVHGNEYLAVILNVRTEKQIQAQNEKRHDDWMDQMPG